MKTIIGCLLALGLLTTCVKKVGNKDVIFKDQILPIFVSNCTMSGCHNAIDREAHLDLSTYEGIMEGVVPRYPLLSEIYTNISGNKPSMPARPYSKLKSKDVELIKLWIDMGAPNTISTMPCDTNTVTFNKTIQPILQTWCVGCHNSTNSSSGVDVSNYGGVIASIENNRLLGSIKYLSGFKKMPQNGSQLSDCEISKISKWIREGALNN